MAILPLIIAPDPRLKTKSLPVETIDSSVRQLAFDMFDTMYHEHGIGLAAVQVGVLKRLLVTDVNWREKEDGQPTAGDQLVMINPEILSDSGDAHVYKEGCLSFPDQFSDVSRPSSLRVRYIDLNSVAQEKEFTGLQATCVQHEIDHLNGVVFVDHISSLKRDMILRKLTKLKKAGAFNHDHHHVHGEHCDHG